MLREIRQVLRALMLLVKERQQHRSKNAGGLLVLLSTESPRRLICTVLTDLKESMFPCAGPGLLSDPEELCTFTDLYGSLRLLLSFQIKIHLKLNSSQRTIQETIRPPVCARGGHWCGGGHPVIGGRLPLSIPPDAMDQGLFGDLSVQLVTVLSPCVVKYPNLATRLTHIQISFIDFVAVHPLDFVYVLVSSPSNVPVTGPSTFLQNLPSHLDCQELGLQGLRCSSSSNGRKQTLIEIKHSDDMDIYIYFFSTRRRSAAFVYSAGTVYTVVQENRADQEQDISVPPVQQRLLVLLFLQHNDQFTCQLSDVVATEVLIEHHLEDILSNNRHAVTAAFQKELKNILTAQNHREKDQEKLRSAAEVILGSSVGIVSSSSNMDFRRACLDSMKVRDTHQLSASLRESLRMVTLWKVIPKGRCFSAHRGELCEDDESTRTEM
ncbi:type 2 DNA topoisomerase 6 subunit B-like [Brachionichthys hirsutus]|uniref:type 2 DNA topoisomerase 6 subunit B-like n=1 Tax=Brachionichthys hirsutus TaxID=412623 RepID=UPI0036051430